MFFKKINCLSRGLGDVYKRQLEHIDDIIDDLDQALNKSSKGKLKAVS